MSVVGGDPREVIGAPVILDQGFASKLVKCAVQLKEEMLRLMQFNSRLFVLGALILVIAYLLGEI